MTNLDMTGLAALGRGEDNYLAHVAKGEMIVPPLGISEDTRNRLNAEMRAVGLDPAEYTVGSGMSVNPITDLPEFGFPIIEIAFLLFKSPLFSTPEYLIKSSNNSSVPIL